MQVNVECSESFVIAQFGSVTSSPLLYVFALEPLHCRLTDGGANLAQHSITIVSHHMEKVSAYANDITVFVSRHSDIAVVKKAVARYEQIAGDQQINFDKSECLQFGAWRGGIRLSGLFHWNN